jgi:long-subunit acyl-CoA synthetase (AMP-forming)
MDICEGWGMSETSGLSCANVPFKAGRIGTIGVPLEGTDLKISEDGELLIRSPGLFTEYFKQPELTKEVFTDEGFFRTGDKAEWDEKCDGYRITGRVKDIFKTAKGKYVVPVPIESQLSANPLLEQVGVIGAPLKCYLRKTSRKASKQFSSKPTRAWSLMSGCPTCSLSTTSGPLKTIY